MTTPQNRIDTIGKLMAQAADPSVTEEEAEAFTDKAMELMAKWGIDDAMLMDAAGQITDEMVKVRIRCHAPYAKAKGTLLYIIARQMNCRTVTMPRSMRKSDEDGAVIIYGYKSDVERVRTLWINLIIQSTGHLRRAHTYGLHGKTYSVGWLNGFNTSIDRRLREIYRNQVAQESTGRADIVLRDRAKAAEDRRAEDYPDLVQSKGSRVNALAYGHGKAAGNAADLGQSRVGSKRGQLR